MTLKLRSVGASDRGLIRSGNQDALHAGPWLVAVADGMGGMAAGDLASRIAIDAIAPLDVETPEDALVAALQGAIELATARIRQAVEEDPERQGMGTTLTALLFARTGSCLALAHVGDSRAYLLREGVLKQVTRDDTFVQMLVDQGVITAEQASSHPRRAVVTQALQGDQVSPSYATMVPRAGDRWLLCSDGLSNVVRADTLAEVLAAIRTGRPAPAADRPGAAGRRPGQHHRRGRRRGRGVGRRSAPARRGAPGRLAGRRVLRPRVPGVAAAQLGAHLRVAGAPERRQVGGDRHRPPGGGEQVQQHRHPAVGERGASRQPKASWSFTASTGAAGSA